MNRISWALLALAFVVGNFMLAGQCGRSRPLPAPVAAVRPVLPSQQSNPTYVPPGTPPPPPPTNADVMELTARIFGDAVTILPGTFEPAVTGDFNGDNSIDVAFLVTPVRSKLAEVNDPLADWIIEDPRHVFVAPANRSVVVLPPPEKPERVQPADRLLVVVHGIGVAGWRSPMARQMFVLRRAASDDLAVAKPSAELLRSVGRFASERDVIAENDNGVSGVLYWTGANYAWHKEGPADARPARK